VTTTEMASAEGVAGVPETKEITEQEIRERAYEIFEKRGGHGGDADEDWYQAESELLANKGTTLAA